MILWEQREAHKSHVSLKHFLKVPNCNFFIYVKHKYKQIYI